jgi:hypothetical protein
VARPSELHVADVEEVVLVDGAAGHRDLAAVLAADEAGVTAP